MANDPTQAPSFWGGLMAGLQSLPTNPLYNMGLGLMAAARPFGNVGESLMQANQVTLANQQAQQQMRMQQLQMQQLGMRLPLAQAIINAGNPQQNPQGGAAAPPSQVSPQGLMTGPAPPPGAAPPLPVMPSQGGTPAPSPSMAPPSWLTPPTQASIDAMPISGIDPRLIRGYDIAGGKDPVETDKAIQAQQLALAQRRLAPTIARVDDLVKSDSPTRVVSANADLKTAWNSIAPTLGYDPVADFKDTNVRQAFSHVGNSLRSSVGQATEAPPLALQTVTLKDGRQAQIDPMTGKETVIEPSELQQVVGPNGTPVLVPKGQAAGMQPFNATIFGAGAISDQSKELAYQQWKATGALPTGLARNPVMNAQMMNFISQRAQQEGIPGIQAAAQHQAYQAQQGVVNDFTKGKSAQTLNGINTAVQHMNLLPPLIDALGGRNMTILNKAQQFFQKQTGNPAPTNFAAIKEFVGGEVAKAVLPGGGGEAERQALTAPLNAANSPAQLKSAVETIQKALAGKTEALRNQWEVGTNGTQGDFNRFLLPATKNALGIPDVATPLARPGQTDLAAAAAAELRRRGLTQ